jgi:hypothetical protein
MSTLQTAAPSRRTWRIPRPPIEDWLFISACGWGVMLVGVPLVGSLIDHWSWILDLFGRDVSDVDVTESIWGPMSGIGVWFVGFVGGYYLHYHFPAFVANGQTRRDTAIGASIFGAVLAVVAAVLITIGFAYERVVYAIAGWERGTPDDALYGSYNDYGQILAIQLVTMLMWTVGGAMIGSSFYRGNERGLVSIVIAIAAVSLVGGSNGVAGPLVFLADRAGITDNLPLALLVALLATVVLAVITWRNVKQLPLRNK